MLSNSTRVRFCMPRDVVNFQSRPQTLSPTFALVEPTSRSSSTTGMPSNTPHGHIASTQAEHHRFKGILDLPAELLLFIFQCQCRCTRSQSWA